MVTQSITGILNSIIESMKLVIPLEVTTGKPSIIAQPFNQDGMGVLIAFTGDIQGRIMLDANHTTMGKLGETMFGMELEGEMLESFAGELSNMIAGNFATILTNHKIELDITPPTIIVGTSKIYGFDKAFRLPISIESAGDISVVVMHES